MEQINDYKYVYQIYDEAVKYCAGRLTMAGFDQIYTDGIKTNLREVERQEFEKIAAYAHVPSFQLRKLEQLCRIKPYEIFLRNYRVFKKGFDEYFDGKSLTSFTEHEAKDMIRNFHHCYYNFGLIPEKFPPFIWIKNLQTLELEIMKEEEFNENLWKF